MKTIIITHPGRRPGPSKANVLVERTQPPRYKSAQLPLVDSSALPWHKRSALSLPLVGVLASIRSALQPHGGPN
jgi:hypothetical protein